MKIIKDLARSNIALVRRYFNYLLKTGIANAIPLLALPFVARMYESDDIGKYALFASIVSVLSIASMVSFQNLVITSRSKRMAELTYSACFYLAVLTSTIFFIIYKIIPKDLIKYFLVEKIHLFGLFSLTLVLISLNGLNYSWLVRQGFFDEIAKNKLILAFSTSFIQVCFGLLGLGVNGLIVANILGLALSILIVKSKVPKIKKINLRFIATSVRMFVKNKNIAKHVFPGSMIDNLAIRLPDFAIGGLFGAWWLGQYAMAQRLIAVPLAFLSNAVQDVFRHKISAASSSKVAMQSVIKKYLSITIPAAFLIYVIISLFSDEIVVRVLGEKWVSSSLLIPILAILYLMQFVASPLSYTLIVMKKYHLSFLWQIFYLLISALLLFFMPRIYDFSDFYSFMTIAAIGISLLYIVYMVISINSVSSANDKKMELK